jgi:hypothetical protein
LARRITENLYYSGVPWAWDKAEAVRIIERHLNAAQRRQKGKK